MQHSNITWYIDNEQFYNLAA